MIHASTNYAADCQRRTVTRTMALYTRESDDMGFVGVSILATASLEPPRRSGRLEAVRFGELGSPFDGVLLSVTVGRDERRNKLDVRAVQHI